MLDVKTQKKYLRILKDGSTLKLDASDAIDLVNKYKDELNLEDQSGTHITESSISKCNGKVIMKFFTLWYQDNKKILYWCPCSMNDIAAVAGADKFDPEADRYIECEWIPRAKQVSFLGSDIKKSCREFNHNKYLDIFVEKYINNDHPIADNIFYCVYLSTKDPDNQNFKCARNVELSPRPEKKLEDAK